MPDTVTYRNAEPFTRVGIGLTDNAGTFNGVPVYALRIDRGTLPNVENLALEVTGTDYDVITASWDMVPSATDYEVEYSDDGVTYTPVDTTALLTYDITSADYDVSAAVQYVRVRATGGEWAVKSVYGAALLITNGYECEEASGTRVDEVGALDLTLEFGAAASATGRIGNGVDGNASMRLRNDSYTIANGTQFAVQGFIYFVSAAANEANMLTLYAGAGVQFGITTNGSGNVKAYLQYTSEINLTLTTNTWYHVIFGYNGTDTVVHVNGGAAQVLQAGAPGVAFNRLWLGSDSGGNNFRADLIFRWMGRFPSSAQIATLYNSNSGRTYAQLLAGV